MKNNKKGFTIIESVIAMLLVAVITGGVFSALMAARRAIIEPSYKEDMAFAAEGVLNELKANVSSGGSTGTDPCGGGGPLSQNTHTINCERTLPEACKKSGSSITYKIDSVAMPDDLPGTSFTMGLLRTYIKVDCKLDTL